MTEQINTSLDEQIEFMDEKVRWYTDYGNSQIVLEMYIAILESLYRLKDLEK